MLQILAIVFFGRYALPLLVQKLLEFEILCFQTIESQRHHGIKSLLSHLLLYGLDLSRKATILRVPESFAYFWIE